MFSLVLSNTDENPERAAGIIIATTNENGAALRRALDMGMAIMAIDRYISDVAIDTVVVDNEGAAHEATTHLVRLGHRRIAIVGGPRDADTAREPRRGYERALREARIDIRPELMYEGDFHETPGLAATRQLLDLADPPSAIFSVNNLTTIGVLRALRERGVAMPSAISLVGFDEVVQQPTLPDVSTRCRVC